MPDRLQKKLCAREEGELVRHAGAVPREVRGDVVEVHSDLAHPRRVDASCRRLDLRCPQSRPRPVSSNETTDVQGVVLGGVHARRPDGQREIEIGLSQIAEGGRDVEQVRSSVLDFDSVLGAELSARRLDAPSRHHKKGDDQVGPVAEELLRAATR